MKNQNFYFVLIFFSCVFFFSNCKQENPVIASTTVPDVVTNTVTNIMTTSATFNGEVTDEKGSAVSHRGFCWSKTQTPTVNDSFSVDDFGPGVFSHTVSTLEGGIVYYVRAYATNSYGTSYGNEVSLTTNFTFGEPGFGGIVFYIDGTGQHGLVCSSYDIGNYIWGNMNTLVGCSATAIGTGNANTTAVVNNDTTTNSAARICFNLTLNGFSDWYLPSEDELELLQGTLYVNGIGNFGGGVESHWSSTENSMITARKLEFNLNMWWNATKDQSRLVRAIRAF